MRKTAKYQAIAAEYRQEIQNGGIRPGAFMPSLREVMEAHKVTYNTAVAAYRVLKEEGLIETRVGEGTKVFDPKKPVEMSFPADLVAQIDARAKEDGMRRSEWLMSAIETLVGSNRPS